MSGIGRVLVHRMAMVSSGDRAERLREQFHRGADFLVLVLERTLERGDSTAFDDAVRRARRLVRVHEEVSITIAGGRPDVPPRWPARPLGRLRAVVEDQRDRLLATVDRLEGELAMPSGGVLADKLERWYERYFWVAGRAAATAAHSKPQERHQKSTRFQVWALRAATCRGSSPIGRKINRDRPRRAPGRGDVIDDAVVERA